MPAWLHRFILVLCAVLAVGILSGLGVVLSQTRAEQARMTELEASTRRRLAEVELRLAEQQSVLDRLHGDPAYVETVIRRRLGYARPEEFVFRFEE
jgi:cell division protein DivIC